MGTGSFGGGSGSFGGGSGGATTGEGPSDGTKSLVGAIKSLLSLSNAIRDDPSQAVLTKRILDHLRNRATSAHIRDLLSDSFVNDVMGDLLKVGRLIETKATWSEIAQSLDVDTGAGVLTNIADKIIDTNLATHGFDVDERYFDRASDTVRGFLRSAVGGDVSKFMSIDSAKADQIVDRSAFKNIIGFYLGGLISETVIADSVRELGSARNSVHMASQSLSANIYDKFKDRYVKKGVAQPSQALITIAANFSEMIDT